MILACCNQKALLGEKFELSTNNNIKHRENLHKLSTEYENERRFLFMLDDLERRHPRKMKESSMKEGVRTRVA